MSINDAGIKLSSAFNIRTAIPLDLRTVRPTIAERDLIPMEYRHRGMPCYVESNRTLYRLSKSVDEGGTVLGTTNLDWEAECCLKYNLDATQPPGIYDNANDGYAPGSIWRNKNDDTVFLLANFEPNGDAYWIDISSQFLWTQVLW